MVRLEPLETILGFRFNVSVGAAITFRVRGVVLVSPMPVAVMSRL